MAKTKPFGTFLLLLVSVFVFGQVSINAQTGSEIRGRIIPAAVQIAMKVTYRIGGLAVEGPIAIGSGTIVSPQGLILTNQHVVDLAALRAELKVAQEQVGQDSPDAELVMDDEVFVLVSDGRLPPKPAYTARIERVDARLDLAVLRIVGDAKEAPLPMESLEFPYVRLGDSSQLALGDPIQVFSYPAIGGDTLSYTNGVVSGFLFEEGIDELAWITTDAVISGGSSGGTAVNASGELIGIPTQGASLDCRPGDTNRDGQLDASDVGCVPVGGSFGQLRPVDLAKPLLLSVEPRFDAIVADSPAESFPIETPTPVTPTATATATPVPTPTPIPPTPTPTPIPRTPTLTPLPPIPLANLLPATLRIGQGQPFRLHDAGAASFEGVVATSPDPFEAERRLRQWGWQENFYRVFASDNPPRDAAGWVELSVDRFATADGAAAALPVYASDRRAARGHRPIDVGLFADQTEAMAGPAYNGDEVTIFARRGNMIVRATGIAPNGDPTEDVIEAILIPLVQVADEPRVVSPELFSALPSESDLPPGLQQAEEHARSAGTIASNFPNAVEAERLFRTWNWRESAARVFTGTTSNGTSRFEVSIFRFADERPATDALAYFLEARRDDLGLAETPPPPAQADEARMIEGRVGGEFEATVYLRRGTDVFRITATGEGNPGADLAALLRSW